MRIVSTVFAMAALLSLAALKPAAAAEGRREISQACALTGCFPGDAPGFPVTVDGAGSYVLTGGLSVTSSASTHAIEISPATAHAEIDLNGFEIVGPVTCLNVGSAISCNPAGTGIGVLGGQRVTVVRGVVRGFAGGGISVADRGLIEAVTAEANGAVGISAAASSLLRHCIARQNGSFGIYVGAASVVEGSIAAENKSVGIATSGAGVVVTGSTVFDNGHDGIQSAFAVLVQGSSAYLNEQAGISVGPGSIVTDSAAFDNDGIGIFALAGSSVSRNTVRANNGFGLSLDADATYHENTVTANGGTVSGGVSTGGNFCNTGPCP